ncbi:MAG: 2TM domain-containing protein [Solirubrobacteraceae bacterium]
MPTQQITNGKGSAVDVAAPSKDQLELRELAVKELERKRRFRMHAISYAAVCVVLIVIWAITEYSNAGGWPTSGFSQSSSIPHEWNIWIIYPVLGLGLILGIDAWNTFGRKPLTEREIRREMDRLSGTR